MSKEEREEILSKLVTITNGEAKTWFTIETVADYIEVKIKEARVEVAQNYFKHEAVGEYDPADYLRKIIKGTSNEGL